MGQKGGERIINNCRNRYTLAKEQLKQIEINETDCYYMMQIMLLVVMVLVAMMMVVVMVIMVSMMTKSSWHV